MVESAAHRTRHPLTRLAEMVKVVGPLDLCIGKLLISA